MEEHHPLLRRSKHDDEGGPIPYQGAHLLVVNDDPDASEMMRRLFGHHGFDITLADTVEDALVKLATNDPAIDIVLVDTHQGGTSQALKLLERIRSHENDDLVKTRVVVSTDIDENRMFLWQSGADGFLVRPYHADELTMGLMEALGRGDADRAAYRQDQIKAAGDIRTRRAAGEPI